MRSVFTTSSSCQTTHKGHTTHARSDRHTAAYTQSCALIALPVCDLVVSSLISLLSRAFPPSLLPSPHPSPSYCLNALLNVEIYREYMDTHSSTSVYSRTWFENFYIATLAAPLVDVLVRCLARNFLKLNLAKAQAHCSLPSSLSICTPSMNAYALLVLRRNPKTILCVITLDLLEILYSLYMWTLQPVKTEALWIKLGFLIVTSILWIWDVVELWFYRRFIGDLPPHVNPIYVCWDVNRSFHWSSENHIFKLLERHEDPKSFLFTTDESRQVRKRIAEWNEGEDGLLFENEKIGSSASSSSARQSQRSTISHRTRPTTSAAASHDEEDERPDSEVEADALLPSRR